jgi:hypothetical protein
MGERSPRLVKQKQALEEERGRRWRQEEEEEEAQNLKIRVVLMKINKIKNADISINCNQIGEGLLYLYNVSLCRYCFIRL